MNNFRAASLSCLLLVLIGAYPAVAEVPQELQWADLVPKPTAPVKPKLKTFFGPAAGSAGGKSAYLDNYDIRSRPEDLATAPPVRGTEGKFMSRPTKRADSSPPAIKEELDGKLVKIGGYVVPLDFQSTKIKEFLLVPFVGACIHVPPPPANQIIYVKAKNAFEVKGDFDPVYVTGKLAAKITPTGLAETGYTIDADQVDDRKQ